MRVLSKLAVVSCVVVPSLIACSRTEPTRPPPSSESPRAAPAGKRPEPAPRPRDANALGFRAYQDGDLARAKGLFEEAIRTQAANPYAWFNLGRVTALLAEGREAEEYCRLDENGVYLALHFLTRAFEIDAAKTVAKLGEADNRLGPFLARDEAKKWLSSLAPLPVGPAALETWLGERPGWHVTRGSPPAVVTFAKGGEVTRWTPPDTTTSLGRWRAGPDGLVVSLAGAGSGTATFKPGRQRIAFGEGRYAFQRLVLEPADGNPEELRRPLMLEPVLGDCENGYF